VRLSRPVLMGAALAVCVLLAIVTWDALKLDRAAPPSAPAGERATAIVVDKAARRLTLIRGDQPMKTYEISLGSNPVGHKHREGDGRTPEGSYSIDLKNARSRFHLSLRVSYPNEADRERARQSNVSPGSDIMVHGLPRGFGWLRHLHLVRDWTDGCMAVTNAEIEEIWRLVDVGTRIEIRP
jgi:murein L,D-transpeptidase YafK